MKVEGSSVTVVEFYQTTWRHNILYINLHSHKHQKFKYEIKINNRKTNITRSVEKVSILLKCGAKPLDECCQTFRYNVMFSSSLIEMFMKNEHFG